MRYYYNEPLAAAWMAKHFDMQFIDEHGDFISDYSLASFLGIKIDEILGEQELTESPTQKYYIHPYSSHIFEPQLGDLVKWKNNDYFGYEKAIKIEKIRMVDANGDTGPFLDYRDSFMEEDDERDWICPDEIENLVIIQRNGIPFMMPEVEHE